MPTIREKNALAASSGRPPRRAGGPLEIIDHQKAARKLKSILGKCEDAALTSQGFGPSHQQPVASEDQHAQMIKSLPSFGNYKRGMSVDGN